MRRILLAGIIVVLIGGVITYLLIAAPLYVGRYQIFSGEYLIEEHDMQGDRNDTTRYPCKVIIKLDTITGETWFLSEVNYRLEKMPARAKLTRQWEKVELNLSFPEDVGKKQKR